MEEGVGGCSRQVWRCGRAEACSLSSSLKYCVVRGEGLILQYQAKGAHLNTIESYFIYKELSNNHHLNDDCNKIFDALLKLQKP